MDCEKQSARPPFADATGRVRNPLFSFVLDLRDNTWLFSIFQKRLMSRARRRHSARFQVPKTRLISTSVFSLFDSVETMGCLRNDIRNDL